MLLPPARRRGRHVRTDRHQPQQLAKFIEKLIADSPLRIARLTLDILGAIPVAPVRVRAWAERPGRRISLMVAEMTPAGDPLARPVARVNRPLVEGPAQPLPTHWWGLSGYLGSVDRRPQLDDPSGARVFWLSPRGELVEGEQTTPLEKLTLAVDAANGVGSALDFERFVFMNTDTDGIGVTSAEIFDRTGFVGTCAQTLLLQRR